MGISGDTEDRLLSLSGSVTVESDSLGPFSVTSSGGTGTGLLTTRTLLGQPGAPEAGFRAYEYRVDMTQAQASSNNPCIQSVAIPFGTPQPFDFNGDGVLDDCYVVTSQAIGTINLTGASLYQSVVTLSFAGDNVCTGFGSFYIGMLGPAAMTPVSTVTTVTDSGIVTGPVAVRAPITAPPVPALPRGAWVILSVVLALAGFVSVRTLRERRDRTAEANA